MKKVEISQEEFKEYYITQNHSLDECSEHFGLSKTSIAKRIRAWGVHKPENLRMEKIQKTNISKYGTACSLQNKDVRNKAKKSLEARYGVSHPMMDPEIKARAIANMKKKINTPSVRKKVRETFLARHGGTATLNSPALHKKVLETMESRYGVKYAMQSDALKDRYKSGLPTGQTWNNQEHLSEETIKTLHSQDLLRDFIVKQEDKTVYFLAKELGCTPDHLTKVVHRLGLDDYIEWKAGTSHYEKEIRQWLEGLGYSPEKTRKVIAPYEIDFYFDKEKVGIEFNGDYYHAQRPKDYHYKKSMLAKEKGIRLIHIWQHEWDNPQKRKIYQNIILAALKDRSIKPVFARKCKVEVEASAKMRQFFEDNNMQGFRGGKFAINLVYNGEVVMSYIMGKSFFGDYEWEVVRGATKLGYRVVGGATRLWEHFKSLSAPKDCVYYVDLNQFNGNSMESLGFRFEKAQPSFRNYWVTSGKVTNRNPREHKKLKELERAGKVLKLWNAGTLVYTWHKPPMV